MKTYSRKLVSLSLALACALTLSACGGGGGGGGGVAGGDDENKAEQGTPDTPQASGHAWETGKVPHVKLRREGGSYRILELMPDGTAQMDEGEDKYITTGTWEYIKTGPNAGKLDLLQMKYLNNADMGSRYNEWSLELTFNSETEVFADGSFTHYCLESEPRVERKYYTFTILPQ